MPTGAPKLGFQKEHQFGFLNEPASQYTKLGYFDNYNESSMASSTTSSVLGDKKAKKTNDLAYLLGETTTT